MSAAGQGATVLAIDTATARATLALGRTDGSLVAADAWDAGHRHAEELLARIARLLAGAGVGRPGSGSLAGVVVGTGPGGFTGLRVGIATARGIARSAGAPLVGVPTAASLEAAAREDAGVGPDRPVAVLLPAGPAGRYLVRAGRVTLLAAVPAGPLDATPAAEDDPAPGATLVAVDLAGRVAADASARGAAAVAGLGRALLAIGAARLRAGEDDRASLVPEYVTMPRGVTAVAGEVAWSRGPR
ncbi:MAG: tRNA (adenosine(37)-N6)-threonylcarbamoyltransferase complex dimerization subunit type 1 TsaB [Chloroflexi bacterium]|nr:tRNA (adenosine(37)-N6)-threonylcarbamoyltransferase complex dimerization subunit type 1 TsaB [Chloroflexota bacterium]